MITNKNPFLGGFMFSMDDILMVRRLTVNEFVNAVGGSIPPRPKELG